MAISVSRPPARMEDCVKMESAVIFAGANQTSVAKTVRLVSEDLNNLLGYIHIYIAIYKLI